MEGLAILFLLVCLAVYFLPSMLAMGKSFVLQVFLLNLLLGWTFLGWVIALIWACKQDTPTHIHVHNELPKNQNTSHNNDLYTALEKLSRLHKEGILTDAEFAEQKSKLLNK